MGVALEDRALEDRAPDHRVLDHRAKTESMMKEQAIAQP